MPRLRPYNLPLSIRSKHRYLFTLHLSDWLGPRKHLIQTAPASNLISIISQHINQTEDPAGNYANEALIPHSSKKKFGLCEISAGIKLPGMVIVAATPHKFLDFAATINFLRDIRLNHNKFVETHGPVSSGLKSTLINFMGDLFYGDGLLFQRRLIRIHDTQKFCFLFNF